MARAMSKPAEYNLKFPSVFPLTAKDRSRIEKEIASMSVEELAGQMIMQGFNPAFANETDPAFKRLENLVRRNKVGGFVAFVGSINNYSWVTNRLQQISDRPLLFGADFERGLAMRIEGMTQFPHNMALGVANNKRAVYDFAKTVGLESRAIGIHQNYAPVLDLQEVSDNPIVNIRAFSRDPKVVSELGASFVRGCGSARVLSTAKHFPGHGSTDVDSHQDVPVISKPLKKFYEEDLLPFKKAIKAGVHSVMVGHLIVPALDESNLPAVISKKMITGLLREKLKFDGLIVTDAMCMQAICNYYTVRDATVRSIEAGSDILLVNGDDEVSCDAILEACKSGRLTRERLESSVRRILAAKIWLGLYKNRFTDPQKIPSIVNTKKSENLAFRIGKDALRIKVRKGQTAIKLGGKIGCMGISDKTEGAQEIKFHEMINENLSTAFNFIINPRWREEEFRKIVESVKEVDSLIVPVFVRIRAYQGKVKLAPLQEKLIKWLPKSGKKYIIISFGDPYYFENYPGLTNLIFTYSDSQYSQKAVISALMGNYKIRKV